MEHGAKAGETTHSRETLSLAGHEENAHPAASREHSLGGGSEQPPGQGQTQEGWNASPAVTHTESVGAATSRRRRHGTHPSRTALA